MNEIQYSLLEAIKVVAGKTVQDSEATKTIQAEIVEVLDLPKGIYKARYLNDNLIVYSNSNIQYSVGDLVYILIPNGDFSKEKIIVGHVGIQSINKIIVGGDSSSYYDISDNLIIFDDKNEDGSFELCSYKSESKYIKLDEEVKHLLQEYFTQSRELCFSFDVRTNLPQEQQKVGNYGVSLIVPMQIGNAEEDSLKVEEVYEFNIYNMLGNVYQFNIPTKQTMTKSTNEDWNIDFDINRPIQLKIFCKDFPHQEENKPVDIWFTNFSLMATNAMSAEDLKGPKMMLQVTGGHVFRVNSETNVKTLIPFVWDNGKKYQNVLTNVYWFLEDTTVKNGMPGYHVAGGEGWRLLNNVNEAGEAIFQSTLLVEADPDIRLSRYKCVGTYGTTVLFETADITNLNADRDLKLYTEDGLTTINKNAAPLVLHAFVSRLAGEAIGDFDLEFEWSRLDKGAEVPLGGEPEATAATDSGWIQTIKINRAALAEENTFRCAVFKKTNDSRKLLGLLSLVITLEPVSDIKLNIVGSEKIYKYDGSGNAPSSVNYQGPASLRVKSFEALSYKMYDKKGKEFNAEGYGACFYTWKFPKHSLLNLLLEKPTEDNQKDYIIEEDANYYLISGRGNHVSIPYNIALKYDFNKIDGTVHLTVNYADITLTDKISIQFLKDGSNGTNGTEYAVVLKYLDYAYGELDEEGNDRNLRMYCDINNRWHYWDYQNGQLSNHDTPTISPVVYKDGVAVEIDDITVQYSWLDLAKKDYKNIVLQISVDENNSKEAKIIGINPFASMIGYYSYILKAEIKIPGEKTLFAFYPIEITKLGLGHNMKQFVGITGGFYDVLFTPQGGSPMYNSTSPFHYQGPAAANDIEWKSSQLLLPDVSEDDSRYCNYKVQIEERWEGNNNNHIGVKCGDYTIIKPILFRYNTYGMDYLNGWDGTKLQLAEDGSYIVAPVIAAGIKEDNNTFTGMIMGEIVEPGRTKVGLTGRSKGIESFFLDAYTGEATFGRPDSGQIIINPTTTEIRWGNGNFYVGAEGQFNFGNGKIVFDGDDDLTLSGVTISWANTNTPTLNDLGDVKKALLGSETTEIGEDYIISPKIGGGYLYITGGNGTSVEINPLGNRTDGSAVLIDAKYGGDSIFTLGTDGSAYFKGKLEADKGFIAGWEINEHALFAGALGQDNSLWLVRNGTDNTEANIGGSDKINGWSLGIGSGFGVTNKGALYCNKAHIQGEITATSGSIGSWTIYTAENGGNVLASAFKMGNVFCGVGLDSRKSMFNSTLNGGKGGRVLAIGQLGDSSATSSAAAVNGTWENAAFQVYANGKLVANDIEANGGIIAGMTMQSYTIPAKTISSTQQMSPIATWCLGADYTKPEEGVLLTEKYMNNDYYITRAYLLYTAYGRFLVKKEWVQLSGTTLWKATSTTHTYLDKDVLSLT